MKLINKYTQLRDEIYNDLVNKIEISKKDKKVLDNISLLDDLEETVMEYLNEHKNIDEEYFGLLDDICDKIFEQNNIEVTTIDQIFYEIAVEYGIYNDEEYDIYNAVINILVINTYKALKETKEYFINNIFALVLSIVANIVAVTIW